MMATIRFTKVGKADLQVSSGSNLMKVLLDNQIPVASSCHGDGVCGKCVIRIMEGENNLSPKNEVEIFLKDKLKFKSDFRVSCQTFVQGDIQIDTSYW